MRNFNMISSFISLIMLMLNSSTMFIFTPKTQVLASNHGAKTSSTIINTEATYHYPI